MLLRELASIVMRIVIQQDFGGARAVVASDKSTRDVVVAVPWVSPVTGRSATAE